jgi:hypothetical protein
MYVVRKHEGIIEQLREFGVFSDVEYNSLPEEGEFFMYLRDLIKAILEVDKQILCLCMPCNGTVEYATVHEVKHWVERL